jgi:hypothetical protein
MEKNFVSSNVITNTPTRISEVEQQVAALGRNEEELAKTIASLEERLYPVLVVDGLPGTTTNEPSPVRVPLAETLNFRNEGFTSLTRRLQSIIDRIDL